MIFPSFMLTTSSQPADPEDLSAFVSSAVSFFQNNVWKIVAALVVIVLGMLLTRYLTKFVARRLAKSKINPLMYGVLKATIKILLYTVMIMTVASIFGIPLTSLITVVGAAGLAVSLALQNSLSNVAANLILLSSKTFAIGDYIKSGSMEGTVQEIGLIFTQVSTADNKLIFIPNNNLLGDALINYSGASVRRLDAVYSVSYEADIDRVKEVLSNIVKSNPKSLANPQPVIRVLSLGESSVDFTVRVWVNQSDYWNLLFDLNEEVKRTFDREGIEIPYRHLDVHLTAPSNPASQK